MRNMVKAAAGKTAVIAAILLALMAFAPQAEAIVANGGTVTYIGSGDVTVTFVGSSADFVSYLVLFTASDLATVLTPPGTPCGTCPFPGGIFNTSTTPLGTTFVLGEAFLQLHFGAGSEMVFAIQVDEDHNGTIDHTYFMGPAGRNPDGLVHDNETSGGPNLAIIGFEDIFNGGDFDYNDLIFSFFPVNLVIPNPGGLLLVGVGLIGFALADWKRRRR